MSDRYARGFSDMADVYVDITPQARRLLDLVGLVEGETVIDVGCGPGTATLLAAAGVGTEGRVLAIDLAPGMLARARHETRHLEHVQLAAMDARTLAVPGGAADVVIANSVLQFTGPGSLAEWRRVARRAVACSLPWGPKSWIDLCTRYVDRTSEPYRSTMRQRLVAAASPPDATAARDRAGFAGVDVDVMTTVRRYDSPEAAFASEYTHGARVFLEELPPDALAEFRADYLDAVRTADGTAELPFEIHFWSFTI